MNRARIVVLTIAVGAGGVATCLNAGVGKAVTLEPKPDQAETLARARQTGTLQLALRSIADIQMVEARTEDQAPNRGESINVVRYGVPSSTTTQQ